MRNNVDSQDASISLRAAQAANAFPIPFGCAQAIAAVYGHGSNEQLMTMLGALSGGVGGCGLTCGAFTGGAMMLVSELQRLGYSQAQCAGMIDELRLRFELVDGTTNCQELTGMNFADDAVICACRGRIERVVGQVNEIVLYTSEEQNRRDHAAPFAPRRQKRD